MKAKRLGDLQVIDNKNPHWKAATRYNHLRVEFPNGEERSLLFTDHEIKKALERASKNPEDVLHVCWLRDIFD